MIKKYLIIISLFVVSLISSAVPPIYPVTLSMDVSKGRAHSKFTIFNTEDSVKKYRIRVRDVDNQGRESVLAEHIRIFPKYIEVEPGKNQEIRLIVKDVPLEEWKDGEYRGSIEVEELDSSISKKYKREDEAGGVSTVINFKYKINMAVYAYKGAKLPGLEVEIKEFIKDKIKFSVGNRGNYSYPLKYYIYDKDGKELESAVIPKLMYEEKREVTLDSKEGAAYFRICENDTGEELFKSGSL